MSIDSRALDQKFGRMSYLETNRHPGMHCLDPNFEQVVEQYVPLMRRFSCGRNIPSLYLILAPTW
jgi:hypothetical protein